MWKNFILILTKLEELERFLNISIPILIKIIIFKLFHVIQNRSKTSKLEKFENGFLNVPIFKIIPRYIDRKLTLYRTWKNYILILTKLEKLKELERFLNVPIPILVFRNCILILMELEEFHRFEDGFLNVPIPNYSAVYRIDRKLRTWKNYILILMELEELERFLNISIPILVQYQKNCILIIMELKKFENLKSSNSILNLQIL